MDAVVSAQEHRDVQGLLGAYALNAVDEVEQRKIERHLEGCDDCAREVAMLSDAASSLASLVPVEDPGDVVSRITRALPARPRLVPLRLAAGIAAIAVAVVGTIGTVFVQQRADDRATAEVLASAKERIELAAQGGFDGEATLHLASGQAVLVMRDVPDPGQARAYQLWAIDAGKPASMAVIDGDGSVVERFDWDGEGQTFAVTIEPDGGSPVPTSDPVLVGT
jgi:anti-sigma-K factor RskA